MSKVIHMEITKCLACPHCCESRDASAYVTLGTIMACALTGGKRIGDKGDVTEDTPIPEWCPLPDEGSQE